MKTCITPTAAAVALAMAAGSAQAMDVYLAAKAFTKAMPDGSIVPMWGYVEDTANCHAAAGAAARLTCISDQLGDPMLPGPPIVVDPSAAGALTIHLSNGLPEPTSLVITGQALPASTGSGPTWDDGSTGPRSNADQRVRSFGSEAAANGGYETYTWTVARSGSAIYHSGTHPQKQVYMGMYGAVAHDAAVGEVFDGVPYQNEIVLFYSDVDPDLNRSIARLYDPGNPDYAGIDDYSTSIDMHARWHLVNGEPYEPGVTADLEALTGLNNLVRLFSTASETVVPTLQGHYMNIHAEDGFRYNWQDNGTANYVPRTQYSAKLPALKTKDAILVPGAQGRFAIYEGGGHMTNPTDPGNPNEGDDTGGMLRFVNVVNPPDLYLTTLGGGGGNSLPGVAGAHDDADIYAAYFPSTFERFRDANVDLGLPGHADIDGLTVVDNDTFYVSFSRNQGTDVTGLGTVQDEDIVLYDRGNASLAFAGSSVCGGLSGGNGLDIDSFDVVGGVLYFTTAGNTMLPAASGVGPGQGNAWDNSDIYRWDGANCSRIFDRSTTGAGTNNGNGNARIDGLAMVDEDTFYISFANGDVFVPGIGNVQDEDVVLYDGGAWTLYFDGTAQGLTSNGQDLDAIDVP